MRDKMPDAGKVEMTVPMYAGAIVIVSVALLVLARGGFRGYVS